MLDNAFQVGHYALVRDSPQQPLRLIRHGRFLSPAARFQFRLHRMATGRVFLADGSSLLGVVIAYAVRVVTLPVAMIGDWLALPVLRMIDQADASWWVVEVRFHGWDAEFVRIAEAPTKADAKTRLAAINSVNSEPSTSDTFFR